MKMQFGTTEVKAMGIELALLALIQSEWSQQTFGTDEQRGPAGPLKHMAIEVLTEMLGVSRIAYDTLIQSASNEPDTDIKEFADLWILLLDAQRRAGYSPIQVIQAAKDKMQENIRRKWPKFDPAKANEAVEHIKE